MNLAQPRSAAVPPPSAVLSELSADRISTAHWEALGCSGWPQQPALPLPGAMRWVAENHRCNALLWAQQDEAGRAGRREALMALQQAIEDCNRQRNEAIDAIDEALRTALQDLPLREDALAPGETAGALIDRLSINALKIYHHGLQLQRPDACEAQLGCCADKLAQLRMQRGALMQELDAMLRGFLSGELSCRVDRQFQAYRDPVLDPCLRCAPLPL